jgi:flagellar biosynthesis protein FlhB
MEKAGRVVGLLVFLAGVAVLFFVFYTAYEMFMSPVTGLIDTARDASGKINMNNLGGVFISTLVKIFLLFIMTYAGSLIASKGIYFFSGSKDLEVEKIKKVTVNNEKSE